MADRLDTLRKNLVDMTPEELREKVRNIRAERKAKKERPATIKKQREKKAKDKSALMAAMDKMSPEQLKALLGELEDGSSTD